jgi:hypothetical protein
MNELEARIECMKIAERTIGSDKSADGLVNLARKLYDGLIGAESASPSPPSSLPAGSAPIMLRSRKDKAKAP